MTSSIASQGYFVRGINNVKVRLYPQVLGINKVHEHNLCNALRDFGLMIKSDRTPLKDGDVISLFLAFTTQKFIFKNDLCIDPGVYSNYMSKHIGQLTKKDYEFPLKSLGEVLSEALVNNYTRITANGMPIIIRGISVLSVNLEKEFFERILTKTVTYLVKGDYTDLKLANLVVSLSKFKYDDNPIWEAIDNTLRKGNTCLNADLLAKMTITVGNCGRGALESTRRLSAYETLLKQSLNSTKDASIDSLMSLSRLYLMNNESAILSEQYINALINKVTFIVNVDMTQIDLASMNNIAKLLGVYLSVPDASANNSFKILLDKINDRISNEPDIPLKKSLSILLRRFG
ncbi:uncharacterized protein BdWA1_003561 [Babesia duncani]|uniref:Uncharacterized protein n=1 Tax=Babesia duncani TaxID=323732 RepID=A0AAD9PHI6_9APIC|nr:hypothetical protein BdWA1_004126 [Babesia duncani]KAK2194969.1 hypothetical protein BdWA1_003561 [Babesia duncani]